MCCIMMRLTDNLLVVSEIDVLLSLTIPCVCVRRAAGLLLELLD